MNLSLGLPIFKKRKQARPDFFRLKTNWGSTSQRPHFSLFSVRVASVMPLATLAEMA